MREREAVHEKMHNYHHATPRLNFPINQMEIVRDERQLLLNELFSFYKIYVFLCFPYLLHSPFQNLLSEFLSSFLFSLPFCRFHLLSVREKPGIIYFI